MLLVDTSELKRPTQRKLHAAWHELHGRRVLASPTVADELAPFATDTLGTTAPSAAERRLEAQAGSLSRTRENELKQQAWWAAMWRDSTSPYRIVSLTPDQEALAERIRTEIDMRCFPTTDPIDIPDLNDAKIEALRRGTGGKLTSAAERLLNGARQASGPRRARGTNPRGSYRAGQSKPTAAPRVPVRGTHGGQQVERPHNQ